MIHYIYNALFPPQKARKDTFTNSKVLLPPLAPQFEESLVEFNAGIDKTFATYLNSAAKHYKEEEAAELPLSGLRFWKVINILGLKTSEDGIL